MGGLMDITGTPEGDPMRVGVPIADLSTGVYSAVGILAALAQRERTGRGCHVDVPLLDVQAGLLANQALSYFATGKAPRRMGNAHPVVVPYQVFPVADGHIIIASGNDNQFAKLCTVLGEPALAKEPAYLTNSDRVKNRDKLIAHLFGLTTRFARADLLAKLEVVGVPAGPINTLADVFADPQVVHRGMRIDMPAPAAAGGSLPGLRTPITIDGARMASGRPSPRLGEHSQDILHEIGMDEPVRPAKAAQG
jgi:crotonobetainyl-CoA:carnitine CoA-transferase CaiB-like acyl-CoA transferase